MNVLMKVSQFISRVKSPLSVFLVFAFSCVTLFAEDKDVGKVPDKINLENLHGLTLWLVGLYNDQRIVYAIVVTLIMAIVGISIAFVADIILKAFGLQVTKITHHE
jgi:hypothetical protein